MMIAVFYGSGYDVQLDEVESERLASKYDAVRGQCYSNCIRILRKEGLDAVYVEGFGFEKTGQVLPFNHGWLELDNVIIDPSHWKKHRNLFFIPLAKYSRAQVDARIERNIYPPFCSHKDSPYYEQFVYGLKTIRKAFSEKSKEAKLLDRYIERGLWTDTL